MGELMTQEQDSLVVRFLEGERSVPAGEQTTFGRVADVVLDEENPYMHRVVGRFVWWNGQWWVENLSNSLELQLLDEAGSQVRLAPKEMVPLTHRRTAVRFSAGGLPYELEVALPGRAVPDPPPVRPAGGSLTTTTYGKVTPTREEWLLMRELARPFLLDRNAGPDRLPTNEDVAATLGWSTTKLNRKLDYLCNRMTKAGVRGLQGRRKKATNRRWVLVQHVVATGMLTHDDLLLP